MATIVLRSAGTQLKNNTIDTNFTNLNVGKLDKLEAAAQTVVSAVAFTGNISSAGTVTGVSLIAGTLIASAGSITDSSGAISFGNENLSTTGTLASGAHTIGTLQLNAGTIQDTSGSISFGNENLSTTGAMGVGETAPLGKLHVKSSDATVSAVNAEADTLVLERSTNCGISVLSGSTSYGVIYFGDTLSSLSGRIRYNHASDNMDFVTNPGGTVMTMTSAADVGIGEAVPLAKLHVKQTTAGDSMILESTEAGATSGPDIILNRNSASPADSDYIGTIKFKGENSVSAETEYARVEGRISDVTSTTEDGSLRLHTMLSGALTQSVTIQNGAMGVGPGTNGVGPQYTLDIQAAGTGATSLRIEGDGAAHLGCDVFLQSNTTARGTGMRTHNDGASGIGWFWGNPYVTSDSFIISRATGVASTSVAQTSNALFTIDNSGLVGIGIALPDGKLHVHAATAGSITANTLANTIVVENSTHGGISILTPDASTGALYFGSPTSNRAAEVTWSYNTNLFGVKTRKAGASLILSSGNAVTAMTIDSSQNVGIGTTDFGSGAKVIGIVNGTAPSGTPTGGGVLYVESGALKYKGSSGTITTLGVA